LTFPQARLKWRRLVDLTFLASCPHHREAQTFLAFLASRPFPLLLPRRRLQAKKKERMMVPGKMTALERMKVRGLKMVPATAG
jgi:hypothetical protein